MISTGHCTWVNRMVAKQLTHYATGACATKLCRSTEGFKMFHSDHSFLSAKYFLWKYKNWLTVRTQHPFFSRILLLLRLIMHSWTAKAQKHIDRVLLIWWKRSYARLTFANWTFSCLPLVTKLRASIDMFKKTWRSAALLVYVNLLCIVSTMPKYYDHEVCFEKSCLISSWQGCKFIICLQPVHRHFKICFQLRIKTVAEEVICLTLPLSISY